MLCTFQDDHSLNQNSPPTRETKTLLKSIRREQILCWDFKDCGRRNESIWILAGSDTPDQPAHGGSTHANRTSAGYTGTDSRHTWHHTSMLTISVTSSRHCCTRMVILRLLRRPHRPGSRPENFLCLLALKVSGVSEALTCQTSNISSYQQLCQPPINSKRSSATITGDDLLVTEYMFSQRAPHLPDAESSQGWSWADGSGVCAEKRWAVETPHTHPASSVPQSLKRHLRLSENENRNR